MNGNAQREDRATSRRLLQRSNVRQRIQALHAAGIAMLWAAFLAARAGPAQAGINVWTSHGPEESPVNALILDPITPTTVYAAPYDGVVYKSIDGGHSWKATGAPNYVAKLAIDPTPPSTIYAVTNAWGEPGSVFKSPDGGDTWQFAGLYCAVGEPTAFVIDPATPRTLYLGLHPQCEGDGCWGGGLCKSTDGGTTWKLLDTRAAGPILAAPTVPTSLYLSLGEDVLVKSVDGGESWTQADTGLLGAKVADLAVDLAAPTTIYAASVGNLLYGVYKSTDGGATWSESSGHLDQLVYTLAIDPLAPQTVYAGTDGGGVFKSTDGGHTWNALIIGLTSLQVFTLAIDPITPRRVYAGTYRGVFAIEQAEQVAVVGSGTPGSCTEAALATALAEGGLVTFSCGPSPITITLTNMKTIAQDTTIDGAGGITLSGGHAVGPFAVSPGADFGVLGLTIADGGGHPGIRNYGSLTVAKSTISGNTGGGIAANCGSTTTLIGVTLSGNSSDYGGAILCGLTPGESDGCSQPTKVALTNCTVAENSATIAGGGIYISDRATLRLTNCTLSANSAGRPSTIVNAGAFDVFLTNTIVSSSIGPTCVGSVTDGGHNLQWPGAGCGATIPSADPLLDAAGVKDNGGPTQTIALLAGSPAIDAGDPQVCFVNSAVNGIDQRGYKRPGVGATACSIGAFEYNSSGPSPTSTPTATPIPSAMASPTVTPTPSPSATIPSATATATVSVSATRTLTATPSPSATPTATGTPTATATPSASATATNQPRGGGGGCTVTPNQRSGAAWSLLVPALILMGVRRREGKLRP